METPKMNLSLSLILMTLLVVVLPCAAPAQNVYHEDFTTMDYTWGTGMDWSTADGEIRLHPFVMPWLGQYDTAANAMEVAAAGDHVYVADGTGGLVVLDVSDPTVPTVVGSYNSPGVARGVAVAGNIVYLADGLMGMQVVNVTNPAAPTLIATISPGGSVSDVVIDGNEAYLACNSGGLYVVDITNPAAPFVKGHLLGPTQVGKLAIDGDMLYLTDYNLYCVDISDPAAPAMVGYYSLGPQGITPHSLFAEGDRLYISAGYTGLMIFDVTNPGAPALLGTASTGGDIRAASIVGQFAYVADGVHGQGLLDISDPANPREIWNYGYNQAGLGIAVDGNFVYLATDTRGVIIRRACEPLPFRTVSQLVEGVSYIEPVVVGNRAYVASMVSGLRILDLSDPEHPTPLGGYAPSGGGLISYAVAVGGDYAFVADDAQGFLVIDIADPTNPTLVFQNAGRYKDLVLEGNRLYIVGSTNGIQAWDVTDPTAPVLTGSVDPGDGSSITVDGNYAYVGLGNGGLRVYEVSTAAFVYRASIATTSHTTDAAVSGNRLYVAEYLGGIRVLDITNPAAPVVIGSFATAGPAMKVVVSGDDLYVAEEASGVERLDISDPANPILRAAHTGTGRSTWGLAVAGDYAYLANSGAGLEVVAINQRLFDAANNMTYSKPLTEPGHDAVRVRLATTQADHVTWQVYQYNHWLKEDITADWSWMFLEHPTDELTWISTHSVSLPQLNPACSDLMIEWQLDVPTATTVTDVPGDQGRQVRLSWLGSGYDNAGSPETITDYAVYRRVPGAVAKTAAAYPPGTWDFVVSVPANLETTYSVVLPTLGDSTLVDGPYFSTFFVRARTADPGVYFDADPDSGWSVDNLAPSVPTGLNLLAGSLTWNASEDTDFRYFTVYGSESMELDATATFIGYTTETSLDVAGYASRYFLLTATDFAGNQSGAAVLYTASSAPDDKLPTRTALLGNSPNPFNPATTLAYDLARPENVTLEIYDIQGRLVRSLVNELRPAGAHQVRWDGLDNGGRRVGSNVYFARFRAGSVSGNWKLMLVK